MVYPVYLKLHGFYLEVNPSQPDIVSADHTAGGAYGEVELTKHDDGHFDARFVAADRALAIGPPDVLTNHVRGMVGPQAWMQIAPWLVARLAIPHAALETRPRGTFGEFEAHFATNQPDGISILYRPGISIYLQIEARG